MTKKELIEKLAEAPDDATVYFDTEAARFHYHMATVDTCFVENNPFVEGKKVVILNTTGPRQH